MAAKVRTNANSGATKRATATKKKGPVSKQVGTRAESKKTTAKQATKKATTKKSTAKKTTSKKTTAKKTITKKTIARATAGRGTNASPTLLSGGNPQIPKGDGDQPVQDYIAAMPEWKRDIGRALDALVEKTVPHVRKAVRWNSPFYGVEGQGWFLSFHCFNKYVKLTFLRGTALNPLPPGTSKHPDVRYLDLREGDPLDDQLKDWIRQASEIPGDNLF